MDLTQEAENVVWLGTHYVFVEKVGPFSTNAPQAWQDLHQSVAKIGEYNQITGY